MFCSNCGNELENSANFCANCGNSINNKEVEKLSNGINKSNDYSYNLLGTKSNKPSGWNWFAFLFGIFWYFYKGMFKKGVIIFIFAFIASLIFPGLAMLGTWIYCGFKGNEDLAEHLKIQ